jgi:hypothetical protein
MTTAKRHKGRRIRKLKRDLKEFSKLPFYQKKIKRQSFYLQSLGRANRNGQKVIILNIDEFIESE